MKSLRWRIGIVVILLIVAAWALWPSLRFYTIKKDAKSSIPKSQLLLLKKKALNLGLDLQGGMYLLLEIDKSKLPPEQIEGALDRAIEIIRNRIDQWGVFEPSIQKLGEDRILVQLPGVLDRERARSLIGRTAQLKFKFVADIDVTQKILQDIDKALSPKGDTTDTLFESNHAFTQYLRSYRGNNIAVLEDDVSAVDSLLSLPQVQAAIPQNYEFRWGKQVAAGGSKIRPLYVLKKRAELTGAYLTDARPSIGSGANPATANQPLVLLTFDRKGAARFAAVTGQNVGKRLAIVLDNTVQIAPVIQERISQGRAQITGLESMDEAKEISVVLRAGALPAPVHILEERSVGPLLGKDSIRRGFRALIVGFIGVVLFMGIYYSLSGLIAILALLLNLIFILALLTGFHATMTLPGMAGLILTVGMAVDANVLIFERIREELRAGKPPKSAVDTGYARAMITILDANVTTLIAALVLLRFGTGPIKGFAVVLSLGIIVSFFTAIFVTKIVFDYLISVRRIRNVSI